MEKFFFGIDFSKLTFDVSILRTSDYAQGPHAKFSNDSAGFRSFMKWARRQVGGKLVPQECRFCGEDTGTCSRLVSRLLVQKGYYMWLESALRIKLSAGLQRAKNDKKDSLEIARYAMRYVDRFTPYVPPTEAMEAIQVLFSRRRFLVERISDLKRHSQSQAPLLKGNKYLRRLKQGTKKLMQALRVEKQEIEADLAQAVKSCPEIERNYQILVSMKGIGLVNAVAMIIYSRNFTRFDMNARRVCSYWGVAPFAQQSGTSLNGKPKVSGYADHYLKSLLSEAALCAMRFCPSIKAYAARLLARGKHPAVVMNNYKNKILHILVAMVRDGRPYDEGHCAA